MMFSEKMAQVILALSYTAAVTHADTFNYRETSGDSYGPSDWNKVGCDDLEDCEGWPDKHLGSIGWQLDTNMCAWCPITGNDCPFNHRMSPIDLVRDRAIKDHPNFKVCPDWHWMNFENGSCSWEDMKGHFEINRHALQIHTPMRDDGDIDCSNAKGERKYPRLDYSKGFPDWWHLDRTDIKVPSEHTQHGKLYAAEVSLAHFYELDHYKNQIGYITIFLQDYPGERPWHYLDKLICEFRREEEKRRKDCSLPPAPVYKMCELYRDQERTKEDFEYFDKATATEVPFNQLVPPPPRPIKDFGGNPEAKRFPLQLCEGDCDVTEDCAPGLRCMRREPNDEVPGCIGGKEQSGDSDYCVFDPFGEGYFPPTNVPSAAPTSTPRPSIPQLAPKALLDFGGTPPLHMFPLQRCQGDCDSDADCADGLVCFQMGANQTVPGCISVELHQKLTDYCILDPSGSEYVDPPTDAPTVAVQPPSDVPTTRPVTSLPSNTDDGPSVPPTYITRPVGTSKQIWNRGWEPAFKLGECEGDCDEDSDCLPELICFQRETPRVGVPGCAGGEEDDSLTDYCVYHDRPDFALTGDGSVIIGDSPSPTEWPVTSLPTGSPTNSLGDAIELLPIGWNPPADQKPLGLCEGDCENDSDCGDGLVCFQRFLPLTAVPGCIGGDIDLSLMDFCIRDPAVSALARPSMAPTAPRTDASLPTEAPTPRPTDASPPTTAPTSPLADEPLLTEAPAAPSVDASLPTEAPSLVVPTANASPTAGQDVAKTYDPPPIDCNAYKNQGVNINRICKDDAFSCCREPRSPSNYCHEVYEIFGDEMESACHHCCLEEERGESLKVGPPNGPHPDGLAPYDECDTLANTVRLCKDESCCDPGFSDTAYCQAEWAQRAGDVERICWSCCFPSKVFQTAKPAKRRLSGNTTVLTSLDLPSVLDEKVDFSSSEATREVVLRETSDLSPRHTALTEEEMRQFHKNNPPELRPGDKYFEHPSLERKLIVRMENFTPKGEKDENAYFEEIHSSFQRRELQTPIKENYEDIYWWPYEWLLKVGTEYYFRYEGSMTVPPCYTVNHWRVLKDPIRVAEHQIKELERLLAWRLNSQCDASTAGKPRTGNPDAVDVNRPLQEIARGHRMVFCECQNWPSKFPKEREWCKKYQTRDPELRLFENPYNWPQQGF